MPLAEAGDALEHRFNPGLFKHFPLHGLPEMLTGLQRTPRQLQSGWAATHAVLLPDHQQFFFRRQDNAADADVVGGEGGDMGAMHKQASEQDIVVARMVEIEAAVDGLGYQPKGYNNFLQILNTIRNWTNARGHHVGKVNAFHYERRLLDVGEVEILTVDEVAELLVVAMDIPACAAVVVLVLLCGLRTSEALAIDWDSVHLDEEPAVVVVRAAAAKKRQRRTVELQPNAAAWLALAKAKGGELGMLDDVYYRAKRAAMPPIPKNGLRHSFCSYHLAKFKNIALTPHFAGNSPTMIDRHYKELVRPKAATAFWELWPDHKPRA